MLTPKPVIKIETVSEAAVATMTVLVERAVIYRDRASLFEMIGVAPYDRLERFDWKLRKIDAQRLQRIMQRAADFEKFDGRRRQWVRCDASPKVARMILRMRDDWPFKWLQTPEPMNESSWVMR
jgi:hypothetical protein